ncbi:MAG: PRC-barrel domain-containing protein [Candidatus Kariarchaeaceae archaeon]|jgi:sporulation protein YlmC with PRC-barrel domain
MDKLSDLSGINMSELDNCIIEDKTGDQIGRLIDCTLRHSPDHGLHLTKFVVGGSKFEEFLELIKVKKDVDPVFSVDVIQRATPGRIQLNIAKDELKSTFINEDAISDDEFKLTSLRRTPVFDANNEKIGRVIDLQFDGDSFQLILGDSVATEWAESVGLQQDIDFLIAPSFIQTFGMDGISLSKEKTDLKSTFIVNIESFLNSAQTKQDVENLRAKAVYFPSIQ